MWIEVAIVGQSSGSKRAGAGVGNDLPSITSAAADVDPVAGEVSGIVLVTATLEDTPGDRADLQVEFSLDGIDWQLARPAQDDTTPPFAFTNVVAELGGTKVAFFWDTAKDLGHADTDALIRFTPFEDVEGTPSWHPAREPVVPRQQRGADRAALQRRGARQSRRAPRDPSLFGCSTRRGRVRDLRARRARLPSLLASGSTRSWLILFCGARGICTEYPRFAHGPSFRSMRPRCACRVRAGGLTRTGIVGRTLELSRRRRRSAITPT